MCKIFKSVLAKFIYTFTLIHGFCFNFFKEKQMKKLFGLSALALMLAFNANAQVDLTTAANDVKATADAATAKVEAAKAAVKAEEQNAIAAVEAKKAELESAVSVADSDITADTDAARAEQDQALKDAKASLDNLRNAINQ